MALAEELLAACDKIDGTRLASSAGHLTEPVASSIRLALGQLHDEEPSTRASIVRDLALDLERHLSMFQRREVYYTRLRSRIEHFEHDSVDELVRFARERVRNELNARKDRLLSDFDTEQKAFTALKDTLVETGRKAKDLVTFIPDLFALFSGKPETTDVVERGSLEERLLSRHFSRTDLEGAHFRISKEGARLFQEGWQSLYEEVRALLNQHPSSVETCTFSIPEQFSLPADSSTILGGGLVSATSIATVALAAGWHTIGYALAHVFLPTALIGGELYAGYEIITQESQKEAKRGDIERRLEEVTNTAVRIVDSDVAPEWRKVSAKLAGELLGLAGKAFLGSEQAAHNDFVDLLQALRRTLDTPFFQGEDDEPATLLFEGHRRLGQGDLGAAVLFGSLAFEAAILQRLRAIAPLNAHRPPIRDAIDLLRAHRAADRGECERLHRIRVERNRLVHEPKVLRAMEARRVRAFLDAVGSNVGRGHRT